MQFDQLKRREFITLLGGAAPRPLTARAQQPAKLPTIGFMGESTLAGQRQWVAAFVERLRELGWIEGRNVAIEYRWARGTQRALLSLFHGPGYVGHQLFQIVLGVGRRPSMCRGLGL